ncbi:uncharacterized protein [Typha angustifolia]|uniref:uncharacterized protein n=1 Tax=Typha angustifolia TaxID=59011 RepID=UPI003C30263F
MGKESALWDDSALVDAFDRAMATYKAMHSKSNHRSSAEEEKQTGDVNEEEPAHTEPTTELELDDKGNEISSRETETSLPCHEDGKATKDLPIQETSPDLHASESETYSLGLFSSDKKVDSYSNQQNAEYNELLRHYYELEEQRQNVLQQLQQASYWNFENPVQSSTCQEQQLLAYNASEYARQQPCSLCSSCCLASPNFPASSCNMNIPLPGCYYNLPCTSCCSASQAHSLPGGQCSAQSGGTLIGTSSTSNPIKQSAGAEDSVFSYGMKAAESAIHSMKTKISGDSSSSEGKEKGKKEDETIDRDEHNSSHSICSESDLAAVLGAWYSAGFHTGRYLLEQSARSSRR